MLTPKKVDILREALNILMDEHLYSQDVEMREIAWQGVESITKTIEHHYNKQFCEQ